MEPALARALGGVTRACFPGLPQEVPPNKPSPPTKSCDFRLWIMRGTCYAGSDCLAKPSLGIHPVSVRRFPSFRTQPLESLSHYLWKKTISEQPCPWRKLSKRESCYGDRVYYSQEVCVYMYVYVCITIYIYIYIHIC